MKHEKFIRGAGVLLAITSLPSSYGIGTLGEAAIQFVDMLVELRQRYWQVLPIGPTSYGDSPYQAYSAFAGNPYMIDLDQLVMDGLLQLEEITCVDWGDNERDVNYGKIYDSRYKILKLAFQRFYCQDDGFLMFCENEKYWLDEYALFMALKEHFNYKPWIAWDDGLRNHNEESIESYKKILKNQIIFWKFLQYKFFIQWNSLKQYANKKGVDIIGDIPMYVAHDSVDVWSNREQFILEENGELSFVSGCPPDVSASEGQKWGNPLYNYEIMEKDNYTWWRKRMHANSKLFDLIRIDHFIGLVRYYMIPASSENGLRGTWKKGPGLKLIKVIEESVGNTKLIAENIGVKLPSVNKVLNRIGWPGMKILLFAFAKDASNDSLPHNYDGKNLVIYGSTHDYETIMGAFKNKSEKDLKFLYAYLGIHSKDEIIDGMIRIAYASIADIVIFQMQDILKLDNEYRMNLPSTVGKNWKFRIWRDCISEERGKFIRELAAIYGR